jgi:hypothetical protein
MRLLIKTGVIVSMTSTIDTATFEVITSTASAPTMTPTITSTPEISHEAPSTNTVMGIAMGIVALALLGGGLALRLGNSKKK